MLTKEQKQNNQHTAHADSAGGVGLDRERRAKLSIVVSLVARVVTLVCGLIVTPLLLKAFGSELYGASASVTQFLSFIILLNGGVSGVSRAALYKPLADNDMESVGKIIYEIRRFYFVVGSIFLAYVILLACSFKAISHSEVLDWMTSFLLVVVISISTFAQYFIGISNAILLTAAQRVYLLQLNTIITTLLNMIMVVILVHLKSNIVLVKFVSSLVYALSPILMWVYVKKIFVHLKVKKTNEVILKQKWTGLGQHIASFLHGNVDIAVLTVLGDLAYVAVYSVYNMVIANMYNVVSSFTSGMEAVFGDMLAKREAEKLKSTFEFYDTWISFVSGLLFSVTTVMIVPFIKIYTDGVNDANYIQPAFSVIISLAMFYYSVRAPYHSIVIAADRFKQTRKAAYGEALINLVLSVVLVMKFGLIGVAIGTLVSDLFRYVYYACYLSKHVLHFSMISFVKRFVINLANYALSCAVGFFLVQQFTITGYFEWALAGLATTAAALFLHVLSILLFYREQIDEFKNVFLKRKPKKTVAE
ncbi:MAG: polysaccharide biosynthesis C-terminal domain-containing protein [Clostridia bacterium]|nr:polysaccharide biosynthesis C-terminal domain-containing protein [Clostridia bacterium]